MFHRARCKIGESTTGRKKKADRHFQAAVLSSSFTYLIQADFSVGDLEDCVSVFLVLLDGLVNILTLIGQLDSGHRHLDTHRGEETTKIAKFKKYKS